MGNKIITEKDFWICSEGNVPAPFQGTRLGTKKASGDVYITVEDKATSSCVDFGCKKYMLLMAIAVAIVVVVAAIVVGTGGAALIAIGAVAGLAGAALGAVIGGLLCGQKMASQRAWIGGKSNFISQGTKTITGNHTMTCPIGGQITFAPQIKSWSQAASLAAGNYIGGLMEGMMAGATVGAVGAIAVGGAGAFATGGIRGLGQAGLQLVKSVPMNVIKNIGATFGYSGGFSVTSVTTALALRTATAAQAGLTHYGQTGESGWGAAGKGVFGMEEGMAHSAGNIVTGKASWQDITGLALLLSPVHKATEETKAPAKDAEPANVGDEAAKDEATKNNEETVKDANVKNDDVAGEGGEKEAYEAARLNPISADPPFKPGDGINVAEFERQITGQQEGMNNLTVDEFLKNRENYKENGRSNEGSKAQEAYRKEARRTKIEELREQGKSRAEAETLADEYMRGKAALHDPDQIAGGNGKNVTGLGDSNVNSSIGSQWKTRIDGIEQQVRDQAKNMTPEEMANTKLNVHLYP